MLSWDGERVAIVVHAVNFSGDEKLKIKWKIALGIKKNLNPA